MEQIEEELESLSYIYLPDELEVISPLNVIIRQRADLYNESLEIVRKVMQEEEENEFEWLFAVEFILPLEYPEKSPEIRLESDYLTEDEIVKISDELLLQSNDLIGK